MFINPFDICIILHGCPPSADTVIPKHNRWMNWVEEQLIEKGLNAVAPDMPTPWNPRYEVWKNSFKTYPVTKKSVLVGHSCGAAFLVRWLLETNRTVKKLILVSPAKIPEHENDPRKDLYDFELPEDGREIAREIVMFTSNDFPHHVKSFELYTKSLKPRSIKLENKFHFLFFQMNTRQFPELLEEIIS